MAISSVKRREDGDDVFNGQVEYDEITHRYIVKTDGTETESYEVVTAAIAANLLPAPGEPITTGSSYLARKLKLTRPAGSNQNTWDAEVTFDNQPIDRSQDERESPSRHDPQDPDNDTVLVSVASQMIQRPEMFDFRGAPCINSAGDLIDPLPELNYVQTAISIEWNSTSAVTAFRSFIGTSNDRDITLAGVAIKERQAVLATYETTGPHERTYKPAGSGSQTTTTYYTHRVVYEVIDIDLPTNVFLLDPANATVTSSALPNFPLLERDSDSVDYDYIPQGHIVANVGYSELRLDSPAAHAAGTDYAIGDTVSSGGNRYRATAASGPGNGGSVTPPNASYWEQYATGSAAPYKHRLTNGDINPSLTGDEAADYVDRPQYLDDQGQFWDLQANSHAVYAMFFASFPSSNWSTLPGVS